MKRIGVVVASAVAWGIVATTVLLAVGWWR